MTDTTNNVLCIDSDGKSYEARLDAGRLLQRTGNRAAAVAVMAKILKQAHADRPNIFSKEDRSPQCIEASAEELLDGILEHLDEVKAIADTSSAMEAAGKTGSTSTVIPVRVVPPDVLKVLQGGRIEGNLFFLPATQLERKLYERVNEVLVAMEGKWKGGKTKAFVFAGAEPDSFQECFTEMLATGAYTDPRDISFFPTPEGLARQIVQMANLKPGERVLEPSAGAGAIALEAAKVVGLENVTCIEFFPPNARKLRAAGLLTHEADFLNREPPANDADKFDAVLMNPPFSNHQDAAHVQHACRFLKPNGRLVAITSTSWQISSANRKAEAFRAFVDAAEGVVEDVPAGTFKSSGTMVGTRIISIEAENLAWNRAKPQTSDTESSVDETSPMEAPAA